jgi:hypothetical protein
MKPHLPPSACTCSAVGRYRNAEGATGPGLSNLPQRGSSGRADGAIGHPVGAVLLPSSQPHHELRVQGLVEGVLVFFRMALAKRSTVFDELGLDVRVSVRVRLVTTCE